jgi:hypothetical protein
VIRDDPESETALRQLDAAWRTQIGVRLRGPRFLALGRQIIQSRVRAEPPEPYGVGWIVSSPVERSVMV